MPRGRQPLGPDQKLAGTHQMRLTVKQEERIESVRQRLQKLAMGTAVGRSEVIRRCVDIGLDTLEARMGEEHWEP